MAHANPINAIPFTLYLVMLSWECLSALQLTNGWKLLASETVEFSGGTEGSTSGPGPRAGSSVWMSNKGRTWLFGGRGPNPQVANATMLHSDLWLYNTHLGSWQRLLDDALSNDSWTVGGGVEGREMAAMCGSTDGSTVIVFGGRTAENASGPVEATSDVLLWQTGRTLWQVIPCSNCPKPRYDSVVWCNEDSGQMHLIGGTGSRGQHLTDSWMLTISDLSWTRQPSPTIGCLWTKPTPPWRRTDGDGSSDVIRPLNNTETNPGISQQKSLPNSQMPLVWQTSDGTLYLMCDGSGASTTPTDAAVSDDPNVELWKRPSVANATWQMVSESGKGAMTWPGAHGHGSTCTDSADNLWLFGGQSQIGGLRYSNNDVWSYNVTSNVWFKVGMPPENVLEPEKRHLAASWCLENVMFVYGGLSCDDSPSDPVLQSHCIRGDLWALNVSTYRPTNVGAMPPTATDNSAKPVRVQGTTTSTDDPTSVTPTPKWKTTSKITSNAIPKSKPYDPHSTVNGNVRPSLPGVPLGPKVNQSEVLDHPVDEVSGVRLSKLDPISALHHPPIPGTGGEANFNQPTQQEFQETSEHDGAYGSAIFFGISLSMFAVFGVVLFFRRCVSCPPRENVLLKEAPPVRYTVIPDESYTI